jgi:glucokinase
MSETVLAIDLGGTRYRAALARADAPQSLQPLGAAAAPRTREQFLQRVRDQLAETGASRLGLGIPGLAAGPVCRWVPNLPYLDGLDLAAALPGVGVALGNDAQFALLAEVKAGAAKGMRNAILLAGATGIRSAVMTDGRIVSGASGAALSFGWAAADVGDAGDETNGWLERNASGRALDAVAARLSIPSGTALVQLAREGNTEALGALERSATALGTALAGAVALLDPEAIIIAGGVAASLDVLEPMILRALRRHLPPHLRSIELRAGQFGPDAGLVGASMAGAAGAQWRSLHD